MSFSINTKQFFLTYPRCPATRQSLLDFLKEKLGVDRYLSSVICQEEHEPNQDDNNTGLHLHAYLLLKDRYHIRNNRYFDLKYEDVVYHPNITPVKSKPATIRYVCKSDIEVLSDNFDVSSYLESLKTKKGYGFEQAAKALKEGKTLKEIWLDEQSQGWFMNNKRKLEDTKIFHDAIVKMSAPRPSFKGVEIRTTNDLNWIKVVNWININFLRKRVFKQKQLWLWSPNADVGKSFFFLKVLSCYKRMHAWLKGDAQESSVSDAEYFLLDEFSGGVYINDLKRLSQMGGDYNTKIRYGGIHVVTQNIPLVVTCQKSIRDLYHNCSVEDIHALESRFLEVKVDSLFKLTPVGRDIDYPNNSYPWFEVQDDYVDPTEFIDPASLLEASVDPLVDKQDIDDSFEDHSDESNEVNKRRKK